MDETTKKLLEMLKLTIAALNMPRNFKTPCGKMSYTLLIEAEGLVKEVEAVTKENEAVDRWSSFLKLGK